ncbi:anti-phage protein KwaB [Bacillus mycoides]|uniref:anti-phage protein KwaB n=1 Tax=Bacillus mycoides TaxID=1405 RepID=UPI003CFE7359
MKKDILIQKIKSLTNSPEEFVCEVLFILNRTNHNIIKRADIDVHDQEELKTSFLAKLNEYIIANEELRLVEISRVEERKNTLFKYDYEELPQDFKPITTIRNEEEFEIFSFRNDKLNEISGIVFVIHTEDTTLVSYKKHYPINLYKRDSTALGFIKQEHRFVQISDDILKIYPDFDFFYLNEELFVRNVKMLERNFGFCNVINSKAAEALELLETSDLVEDLTQLKQRSTELTFARKLAQISKHSIVLNELPIAEIISFAETFPKLSGRFKFNEDKSKFDLSTKKSQNLFLKLLNDDFLSSELTKRYYESASKDPVEV